LVFYTLTTHRPSSQGGNAGGYFQLVGPDFQLVSESAKAVLGRRHQKKVTGSNVDSTPHMGISDDKKMSRKHATVWYERTKQAWQIRVQGKNDIEVDGKTYGSGSQIPLHHLACIKMGNTTFFFAQPSVDLD
jgi:hypothetical protein